MQRGPRILPGQLDGLQKGALGYALILLVVIALVFASGLATGTADPATAEALGEPATATSPLAASTAGATPLATFTAPPPAPLPTGPPFATATGAAPLPIPTVAVARTSVAVPVTRTQTADILEHGTMRGVALGPDGALTLAPTVSDDFAGAALDDATWEFVQWSPGATVSQRDGMLTVNVAAIRTVRTFVRRTFEARVRFTAGPPPYENIAWSADLNGPTAIMIGEPVDDPGHLYARIKQEGQAEQRALLSASFDAYHVYRIAWGTAAVEFFVDGVPAATLPAGLDTPMRAWISAATAGHAPTVDWARVLAYDAPQGTYTSAMLDAGGDATWSAVRVEAITPPGTALIVRTHTSLDGRIWSPYAPLAAGGGVTSPPGRYFQYEVALSGTDSTSPAIGAVTIDYARSG